MKGKTEFPVLFRQKDVLYFLLILSGLAFMRYYRLSDIGIMDDDSGIYITYVHRWLEGSFGSGYSKPGYHLLAFLAGKLIGIYDDTLLYLNSTMDLAGMVILYLLSRRMGLNSFLGLSTIVIYGCLPIILYENTRGLAHLPTMTFVVGSVWLFFLISSSRWKRALLFLCGIFSMYAGMIHPTALCVVLLFPALIFFERLKERISFKTVRHSLMDAGIYLLGSVLVVISFVCILDLDTNTFNDKWGKLFVILQHHHATGVQGAGPHLTDKLFALRTMVPYLFSPPFLAVMVLVFLYSAYFYINSGKARAVNPRGGHVRILWMMVIGYIAINIIVTKGLQSRFLIPIIPLATLGTFAILDLRGLCQRRRWIGPSILVCTILISSFNLATHPQYIMKPKTIFRQMADQLADRIDENHRVLFLPSLFKKVMMETIYLDARWLYRLRTPWQPQWEVLKKHRIRYIMIANTLGRSPYSAPTEQELRKTKVETNLMLGWLRNNNIKMIYRSEELYIFELDYPSIAGNAPIMTPAQHPFYNSLQAAIFGPRFFRLTQTRK